MSFSPLFSSQPSWTFPGTSLDMDFTNNRNYLLGGPNSIGMLNVTRASIANMDDLAGNWTPFGNNQIRISNKGILIERSATNSIRNNSAQGAVAGTPGTLPTNWGYIVLSNLSTQIVGTGTELGVDYVDIRFFGTPNATTSVRMNIEAASTIVAANGQTWSMSGFVKVSGGDLTNVGSVVFNVIPKNAGGGSVPGNITVSTSPTTTLTRFSGTGTLSDATTAFLVPEFQFGATSGLPVDVTFRIGWPQLEQSSYTSTPIRTTSAASTRAGDVAYIPTGPWYSDGVAGIYIEFQRTTNVSSFNNALFSVTNAGTGNYLNWFNTNSASGYENITYIGTPTIPTFIDTNINKVAVSVINTGTAYLCSNGGAVNTQSPAAWSNPSIDRIYLGADRLGVNIGTLYIRRFSFFKSLVQPATLQLITT